MVRYRDIPPEQTPHRILDPVDLFRSLRVKSTEIRDLLGGQHDALSKWHEKRSLSDVAIVLNTGAGKTLVGLLAAKSICNEDGGRSSTPADRLRLSIRQFVTPRTTG